MNTKILFFIATWLCSTTQAFSVVPRTTYHVVLNYDNVKGVTTSLNHIINNGKCNSNRGYLTEMNLSPLEEDEKENVNVNLVNDVDSFTLTAIGFALIAFNFLVFANMGDAGIGGIVARIINAFT